MTRAASPRGVIGEFSRVPRRRSWHLTPLAHFLPLAASTVFALASGCHPALAPCVSTAGCSGGEVCEVGRCAAPGAPVAADSRRVVLDPLDLLNGAPGGEASAVLGSGRGEGAFWVRFSTSWGPGEVDAAFLLLEPATGAAPSPSRGVVEVAPVDEAAWPLTRAGYGREHGPVGAATVIGGAPLVTTRIDVTALVREAVRARRASVALIVRGEGGEGAGSAFGTGADGRTPPRLDLYLRARTK